MKKPILERYERGEEGEIIIDISAKKVEDLYSNFDKKSHFLKKDLNQDLVDYMIESVEEIDDEKFIIRFNFESQEQDGAVLRVKESIKHFFTYMQEHAHKEMKSMQKKSMVLFFLGLAIVAMSLLINKNSFMQESMVAEVIAEGLIVASWVSLWEALATFLVKWMPYKKRVSLYKRIANAQVAFVFNTKFN